MEDARFRTMLKWVLLVSVAGVTGLPVEQIKGSGEKTAQAVLTEMAKGKKLLDKVHEMVTREGMDGHPAFHQKVSKIMEKQLEGEEGLGGTYAVYMGSEGGVIMGLQFLDDKTQLMIGKPPSDPKLDCPDKINRKLCITPPNVVPGYVTLYNVNENADTWGDETQLELAHNMTFDPRRHSWYTTSQTHVYGNPFVYNHDERSSGLGVTISRGVFKDGKHIGTVGVDIDLNGLDMVLGPLRPAPGAEAVLADPSTGKVIASTLPAARMVRFTRQQVGCFTPPFTQIFSPLAHTLGGLQRAARIGPILLTADQMIGNLLRWDAIYSHPVPLSRETTWLLVVTDDSEHRSESASQFAPHCYVLALLVLSVVL